MVPRQVEVELTGPHDHQLRIRSRPPAAYGPAKLAYSGGMKSALRSEEPLADATLPLPKTVPALFQQTAQRRADAPALFFKAGQRWVPITWKEYARAVGRLANALMSEGLHSQDRVAVWSANRPQWQIADLGIVHAGAVTVAVYPTLAPDQVKLPAAAFRIKSLDRRGAQASGSGCRHAIGASEAPAGDPDRRRYPGG